ncbi:MAG: rod shape-determining protein MreC [Cyanobacteriota bacterium]|nr:rod shape-determining protein MreC [Cyanobacteriota bacterium]
MQAGRGIRVSPLRLLLTGWPWLLLAALLVGVRLSKGAGFNDLYALVSRPFWPGTAQAEWLRSAQRLDQQSRLRQLEADNQRLRQMLSLQQRGGATVAAPVIARPAMGWWQQLLLGKGALQGITAGAVVQAPGGLLGRVISVTPTTAVVQLLTDSGSKVGVWVPRTGDHGLLVGLGTARPVLRFLDRDARVRPGDLVTTSPASTLAPPNLTVGVVQHLDELAMPAPEAVVQLSAPLAAVDWVQVRPLASVDQP